MKYIAFAVAALAPIHSVSAKLVVGKSPIEKRELERSECGESKQLICKCTPIGENCKTLCVSGNQAKQSNGDGDSGAMVTPGACADETALELASDLEDQLESSLEKLASALARNEELEAEVMYKAQLASAHDEIEDLRFAVGFLHSQLTGVDSEVRFACKCPSDFLDSELSAGGPNKILSDIARFDELEDEISGLKYSAPYDKHYYDECMRYNGDLSRVREEMCTGCPPFISDPDGCIEPPGGPNPSDKRFKKNITPISDPMALIKQLNGVTWNWKTDDFPDRNFDDKVQIGFIAQELEEILPDTVLTNKRDGYKSVYYTQLIALLAEGIKTMDKEYSAFFDEMKEEIKLLKMERQAVQ